MDPDSPHASLVGRVGTYRAQEALTHQVVEAMARAVRSVPGGPATGAPLAFAVSTGDATDNSQMNELESYLALLDGGRTVVPDSGDPDRFEGVGSPEAYDCRYYHPGGTPSGEQDDVARAERGFPLVPGLLDVSRRPFRASGVGLDWFAVHGNHDALVGGTLPADAALSALALGGTKPTGAAPGADLVALLAGNEVGLPLGAWGLLGGPHRTVTADPRRRPVGSKEWIAAHLSTRGSHGLDLEDGDPGSAFYAFDAGIVRFLVLDTVNRAGGWQGSIDQDQLDWLEDELVGGHSQFAAASGRRVQHDAGDRLFVLCSHHPLETLVNPYASDGSRRFLAEDLAALLARFSNVVAWVAGHTHSHAVAARPASAALPGAPGGFWQITTASHIDWPQQARLLELAVDEETGALVLVTTTLDHAAAPDPRLGALDDPLTLAAWSRELALNAWQGRSSPMEPWGRGRASDRNVALVLPAPFAVGKP